MNKNQTRVYVVSWSYRGAFGTHLVEATSALAAIQQICRESSNGFAAQAVIDAVRAG